MATSEAPAAAPGRPGSAKPGQPEPSRGPALATFGVAVLARFVALLIGGAAAPAVAGLADAGALVRWGLPFVTVLRDLSAATTIGLLVVGALLLPGRGQPAVMLRAARYAVGCGVVWVASGLVAVVLGFADAAGTPLTDPMFWSQLSTFIWSLETLRVGIISAVAAAVAVSIAAVALTRGALMVATGIAVAAVLPLALAGHAAGSSDHEMAVNTLAMHLVGAALWAGGLIALVVLRPLLGSTLPVVVARYSGLAGWCFAAVALSGVASGVLRLGGLGNLGSLTSAYGVLLLVKTACLVVLGAFGFLQRRRVVGRMTAGEAGRALFARFAVVEVLIMGVAFGFASALSRTAPPDADRPLDTSPATSLTGFPEPAAPDGSTWFTVWRFDWLWGIVAILAVAVYLRWVLRLRRRGDSWSLLSTVSWVLGWAVLVWATCGAPAVLGRVSFSWHMIMHMVVAMYAPPLLVLGSPVTLALRAIAPRADGSLGPRELILAGVHSRLARFLGNPIVAAALFFGSLAVFYYSPLFELALTTHTGHVLMVTHFLLTGYLFAWVLIGTDPGPPKWPAPMRLLLLLVTISFHAFFGVAIMSGQVLLAPGFFEQIHVSWIEGGGGIVADQQRGGSIAWAIGEAPTLLLAMLVVRDWVRTDAAETKRKDRQAARDGGAELAAYNARLQAMATREDPKEQS